MVDVLKDPKKESEIMLITHIPELNGESHQNGKIQVSGVVKPGTSTEYELYDYNNDSIESENLYIKLPKVANRLKTILKNTLNLKGANKSF